MLTELTDSILHRFAYETIAGITILWFLFLYFGGGAIFMITCRALCRKGYLEKIVPGDVSPRQRAFEIRHSLLSILIFGLSGLPLVWLVRQGYIHLLPDTAWNIAWGLLVLTLWNEVHFFIVHRLMHTEWLMRHVHHVHHRSRIPTVWSVFSFHPLEAMLLSTVPLTLVCCLPLAPACIVLFPLVSILLNFAGHANFRVGNGTGSKWTGFATRHAGHHSGTHRSFGFASHLPDLVRDRNRKNLKKHEK
ncbi:MAG: sterol desaturase family protein [Cyclobacteriaceae bacterium]